MFMELYKFSKLVMHLNSCSMDLGRDRSVSNSLPTKSNLVNRKILQNLVCHLCSSAPEDVIHALWGCVKIKHIWSKDFGWVDRTTAAALSFKDLVHKIREKPQTLALFAATAWSIWQHRNKSRL